ncbi:MAG: hypothetical protein ABMA01_21850 [Chthoniobacteraceae bacterium]
MTRFPAALLAAVFLAGCAASNDPLRQIPIPKANVLPLALDDSFEFRKVTRFLNDARFQRPTDNAMLLFERRRLSWGAVTARDLGERFGYYFDVWWRSARPADVTLRLEYRQENLGSFVQAKEIRYSGAKGNVESKFTVIGDEYIENGKITAWRLLLIENGRIVGLKQSFLWN